MNRKKHMGRQFLHIILAAVGMMIAITGIAFKTGYFQVSTPDSGYALLVIGIIITIFYLRKMNGR